MFRQVSHTLLRASPEPASTGNGNPWEFVITTRPEQPGPIRRQQPQNQANGDAGVMVLCTYCGSLSISTSKCSNCGGHFDLLSRQRTQNGMGPWFIRDQVNPFHPGCSYDTLRRLIARGRVRPDTVMRGPTTRQFWSFARNTPGVAHLLGACHACHAPVDATAHACPSCAASFVVADDRQQLGLAPMQMLPGDADPAAVADAAFGPATPPREPAGPVDAAVPAEQFGGLPDRSSSNEPVSSRPAVSRPVRKRSAGPMVAVVASVGCAVVALAAVVYMNRTDGNAAAAAAEPSGARVPSEQALVTDRERRELTAPPNPRAAPDPVVRVEPVGAKDDSPSLDPQVVPDAETPLPEADARPETVARPSTGVDEIPRPSICEPASIASMSREQLDDARAEWAKLGKDELVRLADRRLRQIELRGLFGPD